MTEASSSTISSIDKAISRHEQSIVFLKYLKDIGVVNAVDDGGCVCLLSDLVTAEELVALDKHLVRNYFKEDKILFWVLPANALPDIEDYTKRSVRIHGTLKTVRMSGAELYEKIMSDPSGKVNR